jgi:hypothetical protein
MLTIRTKYLAGFVISYGVLQEQYTANFLLQGSRKLTGVIGPLLNGVLYISLPFLSTRLAGQLSQWKRTSAIAGILLSSLGLVLSASSTAVWHLIITQGILEALLFTVQRHFTSTSGLSSEKVMPTG